MGHREFSFFHTVKEPLLLVHFDLDELRDLGSEKLFDCVLLRWICEISILAFEKRLDSLYCFLDRA